MVLGASEDALDRMPALKGCHTMVVNGIRVSTSVDPTHDCVATLRCQPWQNEGTITEFLQGPAAERYNIDFRTLAEVDSRVEEVLQVTMADGSDEELPPWGDGRAEIHRESGDSDDDKSEEMTSYEDTI